MTALLIFLFRSMSVRAPPLPREADAGPGLIDGARMVRAGGPVPLPACRGPHDGPPIPAAYPERQAIAVFSRAVS